MPTVTRRENLRHVLREYADQRETVFGLQARILDLIRSGLDQELSESERRRFYREFSPVIDMYDPKLQPRPSTAGRIMDFLGSIFGGDRRVTEDEVRQSVVRLLNWV